MVDKYRKLEKSLGHVFANKAYLSNALTHRSASSHNNERLEYLGDAILSFVISDCLYLQFEQAAEGQLTRLRASLVKGETLATLAKQLGLSEYIILSPAEYRTGGMQRPSILADALEAVIAAIYLDAGFKQCEHLIQQWYQPFFETLSLDKITKDPKTQLQEYLQAKQMPLPMYEVLHIEGKGHEQIFTVQCALEELNQKTKAQGSSRRKAEQAAAEKMLGLL